jgi:hypothetical protein
VGVLLGADLAVCALGPLLIPDESYLRWYLGRDSIHAAGQFATPSASYLLWDPVTGWRNRPGARRSLWIVDEQGARVSTRKTDSRARGILFLGDSVTNGGTAVSNDETISAYVEDRDARSVNFATMLYGVDQMYLALREQLRDRRPSTVVIGLTETSIEALGNRYVPLRRRHESNMPFFKPRFTVSARGLLLHPVPTIRVYADPAHEAALLPELAVTDDYYRNFAAFRRAGFLPLSATAWAAWEKGRRGLEALAGDPYLPLLLHLARDIASEAKERGAKTIFLLHATASQAAPASAARWLPDRYATLLSELSRAGLTLVDGREALRRSGFTPHDLYASDGVHYRPQGNRVIAAALRSRLSTSD